MARHTYEYGIDLESDVAPARVLRMIEPGSRVLEVGAGPGSITRHLMHTLHCDVVALEIDTSAIEKLREFARCIYKLDLNDSRWCDEVREREGLFDYVIAADVLEHVVDPWRTLGEMKSLLNASGSVVLSLPHCGHAAVLACMMDEDFDYGDWGLLDRTHLRFFGVKNVEELYASQDLVIQQAEFVVRTPTMTEFVHRWNRLSPEQQAALQANPFSHVYQVVSRAVPADRAATRVSLLDLDVPPPDAATVARWEKDMSYMPVPEDRSVAALARNGADA